MEDRDTCVLSTVERYVGMWQAINKTTIEHVPSGAKLISSDESWLLSRDEVTHFRRWYRHAHPHEGFSTRTLKLLELDCCIWAYGRDPFNSTLLFQTWIFLSGFFSKHIKLTIPRPTSLGTF